MEGKISFKESLESRLKLSTITKEMINKIIHQLEENIVENMKETILELKKHKNVDIFIVSGGFIDFIEPIAKLFEISSDHIYANKFIFDKQENVIGIEETLLLQSCGKGKVIEYLKNTKKIEGKCIMIGDGYTDLETYLHHFSDEFICFCGVINREIVKEKSKYIAFSSEELKKICLEFIL